MTFSIVIGEYSIDKVQEIYDAFIKELPAGIYVKGNYVDIEPKQADWLDDEDSILKAKCAVQLKVVCTGGVYNDIEFTTANDVEIKIKKEKKYGDS